MTENDECIIQNFMNSHKEGGVLYDNYSICCFKYYGCDFEMRIIYDDNNDSKSTNDNVFETISINDKINRCFLKMHIMKLIFFKYCTWDFILKPQFF